MALIQLKLSILRKSFLCLIWMSSQLSASVFSFMNCFFWFYFLKIFIILQLITTEEVAPTAAAAKKEVPEQKDSVAAKEQGEAEGKDVEGM